LCLLKGENKQINDTGPKKQRKGQQKLSRRLFSERRPLKLEQPRQKLKTQLSEASSNSVKRFLGNNSFKYAAQFAVRDLIKYNIYRALNKLAKLYLFCPEYMGFAVIA
jgi:hypothetical protein